MAAASSGEPESDPLEFEPPIGGLCILCSACGSSTHKCPTHRDCPFNSAL